MQGDVLFTRPLREDLFPYFDCKGQFKCKSHNHIVALAYSEKCLPKKVLIGPGGPDSVYSGGCNADMLVCSSTCARANDGVKEIGFLWKLLLPLITATAASNINTKSEICLESTMVTCDRKPLQCQRPRRWEEAGQRLARSATLGWDDVVDLRV